MVSPTSIFLGFAALSLNGCYATNIADEFVMPVPETVLLDAHHPALGRELDANVTFRPVKPSSDEDGHEELMYSSDMQRLEAYFRVPLERNTNRLPPRGSVTTIPWPSSYWATCEDGINARWNGDEPSPAEKYARAFGLNVKQFMDGISYSNGILSQRNRRPCSSNQHCQGLNDDSVCSKREGEASGYCIPTWFGICHAWAPAAIMEPEPECAVIKNGITFRPFDIKALISQLYDGARLPTVMTGMRYNGPTNAAKDVYGRFISPEFRDLNPGYFHIALTNMLGRYRRSFILDVAADYEVWNQPVRSYEILNQTPYSPQAAARQFWRVNTYPFNQYTTTIMYTRTRVRWISEGVQDGPTVSNGQVERYTVSKEYNYLLELDAAGNILGGEWLYNSNADHPDFLWFPTTFPARTLITNVNLSYKNVRELLEASLAC